MRGAYCQVLAQPAVAQSIPSWGEPHATLPLWTLKFAAISTYLPFQRVMANTYIHVQFIASVPPKSGVTRLHDESLWHITVDHAFYDPHHHHRHHRKLHVMMRARCPWWQTAYSIYCICALLCSPSICCNALPRFISLPWLLPWPIFLLSWCPGAGPLFDWPCRNPFERPIWGFPFSVCMYGHMYMWMCVYMWI